MDQSTNSNMNDSLPAETGNKENKEEVEQLKLRETILEKENNKLKLEYAGLAKAYKELEDERNRLKKNYEEEKAKLNAIFNDDTLIKLYYSKDWKLVLKLYAFKKKFLSNDSVISQKINSVVDFFKPKKKLNPASATQFKKRLLTLQKNVDYTKTLTIPYSEQPQVSIIIPVYNAWKMNYRCVKSIIENTTGVDYEIILADDCSTDETKNCTDKIKNVVHVYNKSNLGFLRNCNHAATYASGEFILFLNNDTEVLSNWLAPMINLFADKTVGMAGSKLVYPDGTLQEAGGIVWNDASGWNYGKHHDPDAPEYNYVKECDYISGASIVLRKKLWEEIGGFDELYVPAYCEDSDLAFVIRQKGYKVLYQPLSEVVHFESITHNKEKKKEDGKLSIDSVRILNQKKFFEKWKEVLLKEHFPNAENVFHARDRSANKKTILVIDHYVPEYDKDAGSKTVYQYLELFVSLGLNVKFLGDNFHQAEPYTGMLQQMGIEVLYGNWYKENWKTWIQTNKNNIDFVFLNRPHTSLTYLSFIKQHTTAKVLYYGHDLHFLRELRKYEIDKDPATLASSKQWKSKEQFIYENADQVLTCSEEETAAIREMNPAYNVATILPYFFKIPASAIDDFSLRKNLLFVGGFGHPPNEDGVTWFCKEVWPKITAAIPGIVFTIVGSKVTPAISQLKSANINVAGFVNDFDLKKIYDSTKIAIIPMRYGAGVKGKTVEAMYNGIPVVSTTIGLEGMPGIYDFMQAFDSPDAFAEAIIRLYNNETLLKELSEKETTYINTFFTQEAAGKQIRALLQLNA